MPPQAPVQNRRSVEFMTTFALLGTLAAALFVVLPFLQMPSVALKTFVLAGGALLTLALYILARLSRGNVVLPPLALVGALWLPLLAYALSAAFSGASFSTALWGLGLEPDTLGFMLIATILGTMAALSLRRTDQYRTFFRVGTVVFVALVALQILIIIAGQVAPETISPAFSLVGSLSDLAFVLGLGVVGVLVALRELELGVTARRVLTAGLVGALFLLAAANSSLVWILLALVSLGLFVESVMLRSAKQKDGDLDGVSLIDEESSIADEGNRSLALPLGVLVVSLFFLIGGTLGGALGSSLGVSEINVRPSWQATFDVGGEVLANSSVFGSGPGTFGSEWLKYRDASLNSTLFWNIDFSSGIGFIPTSIVTTGFVGAAAWIAFLAFFLVIGLRMLIRRAPQDTFTRYVAMFSFIATVYLFAVAIFDLPNTLVLVLAFVFAGLFASTMRFALRGEQWGVIFSRSPRLGFIIVFSLTIMLLGSVVVAYALVGRFIAMSELSSANVALARGDLDAASASIERSVAFAPSAAAYQVTSSIARARLGEVVSSTTMPTAAAQAAFQEALSAGISAALSATTLAPADYRSWLTLGNLYAQAVPLKVEGAYENAVTSYEKAQAINPTSPEIPYILAQLDAANGDTAGAEEHLKAAIALKQDYTAAIFMLSQLQVQQGRVDDALSSALAAAYFTPNNPNILFQVGILYAAKADYTNAALALRAATVANPQFANARYFLSAVLVRLNDMEGALAEMRAVAAISPENAEAVATQLASLEEGKNPFPANLLSLSQTPPVQ